MEMTEAMAVEGPFWTPSRAVHDPRPFETITAAIHGGRYVTTFRSYHDRPQATIAGRGRYLIRVSRDSRS